MHSAFEVLVARSGRRTVYAFAYVLAAASGDGLPSMIVIVIGGWLDLREQTLPQGYFRSGQGRDAVMHVDGKVPPSTAGGCGVEMMLVRHCGAVVCWSADWCVRGEV
ncbi:hypothetical protein QBC39DRAFT_362983 [Podospora conica]|nr:hypothetical protein QBC39DRAFT_362983 [Schizothecium conicum]